MKTKPKIKKPTMAKVLIVDDDVFLSKVYALGLTRNGFAVTTVENGVACLESVKSDRPDLILLDIIMPNMGGFEVLKRLKSDAVTKDIPIIVLSSLNQKDDVEESLALGAADFMPKTQSLPITVSDRIRTVLGIKK